MMSIPTEGPSYEEIFHLIGVFSGDKDMLNWFLSLQSMNEDARSAHLRTMADGVRTTRERPNLIAAVELLISPHAFKSATKTVESLRK